MVVPGRAQPLFFYLHFPEDQLLRFYPIQVFHNNTREKPLAGLGYRQGAVLEFLRVGELV